VDPASLRRAGFAPTEEEAVGRLADELRRVKRPVLDNVKGYGNRKVARAGRIMVTSAEPSEGKTFTAVNLALSLAREPDFEVILIDGDIPKSDVTEVLGLTGQTGLMDLLADTRRQPTDVILQTDVPNLLVVPAGERHPLAAEMFGSRRMQQVLEELRGHNRQRLLLFDSSPLLATSESPVLASHMGQVVMVVAAARTRRQAVDSAMDSLDNSQYVGMILNMSRLPSSENHYDNHYSNYRRD
jgi:exopolysaccharide/PEP-CTERM locus tyrosine autokinase